MMANANIPEAMGKAVAAGKTLFADFMHAKDHVTPTNLKASVLFPVHIYRND